MSETTKTYQDHLNEAKNNSTVNIDFIKLSQHPLLVEMDKLVRSYAKSHFDAFPKIDLTEEETRKQYADFCKTRDTDNPIIGDKVKDICEYYLMRRNLERYIHCWDSCLKSYCDDVVLFK